MPDRRPPSLLARAVGPVLVGLLALGLVFGGLWVAAEVYTRNADDLDVSLGDGVFEVGRVDRLADEIAEDGPLLFPGLRGPAGARPVGLSHDGDDDFEGWRVFGLVPEGADASCLVEQDPATGTLQDCTGTAFAVEQLPTPSDVTVLVDRASGRLALDLAGG